jgi:hypothetical protein
VAITGVSGSLDYDKFVVVDEGILFISHAVNTTTNTAVHNPAYLGSYDFNYLALCFLVENPGDKAMMPYTLFNSSGVNIWNLYSTLDQTAGNLTVTLNTPNVASGFYGSAFTTAVRFYILKAPGLALADV